MGTIPSGAGDTSCAAVYNHDPSRLCGRLRSSQTGSSKTADCARTSRSLFATAALGSRSSAFAPSVYNAAATASGYTVASSQAIRSPAVGLNRYTAIFGRPTICRFFGTGRPGTARRNRA